MGQINDDIYVNGSLSSKTFTAPAASIGNAAIAASAGISASKVQQQRSFDVELFAPGTTVTALTKLVAGIYGTTGTLVAFSALTTTVATGADRHAVVDLQRSTSGGAFATVLSATIDLTSGSTVRTWYNAAFSSTSLVAGDTLQVVVTVSGSASAQAAGLVARLILTEDPA